jgi:hypothetical protein
MLYNDKLIDVQIGVKLAEHIELELLTLFQYGREMFEKKETQGAEEP